MATCCNTDPTCCCVGDIDKKPGEVLAVTLDLSQWVGENGTILTNAGDYSFTVYDVTNDAAAPAPPAGVGVVANSVTVGRDDDGVPGLLMFGIEGGTAGTVYRIDFELRIRDCNGFVQVIQNCITVRVYSCN